MSNTLSTLSFVGITLSANGADLSPFTVTPSGTISTTESFGVYSTITAPMLANSGLIAAAVGGVDFKQDGTVVNEGTILATGNATYSGAGIYLQSGGYVGNSGTAAVIMGNVGVQAETLAGTILNTGTITGTTGIALNAGGLITNKGTSAVISGTSDAVSLYGANGTIVNQGTISGQYYGVKIVTSGAASITNSGTSALISGGSDGVVFKYAVGATVVNDGTISSAKYVGVYSKVGGAITNTETSAVITGASGISLIGSSGTVLNAGAITGTGNDGVFLGAGGTITNDDTASTILGVSYGVVIETAAGTVMNDGTIIGTSRAALYLGEGGSATNSGTSALISGGPAGVEINHAAGTVLNEGTIRASGGGGIDLFAGGSVINSGAPAFIAGGTAANGLTPGVYISGGAGYVMNAGTILGGTGGAFGGDGVEAFQNLSVTNTGLIHGGSGSVAGAGVYLYSQSTLNNQGTIIGGYGTSYGNGIRVESGNVITNGATNGSSALILGNDGVVIQGNSSLINYATIAGRNNGLYIEQTLTPPASVTNAASGTITGVDFGVYLKAAASLTNSGLFTNAGLISGQENGFVEYGLAGTILNTGTIAGLGAGIPTFADGIFIEGGADIINGSSNASGALISGVGNAFGVDMITPFIGTLASLGTVINYGTIHGGSLEGVRLNAGTVMNGTAIDNQALITGVYIAGSNALVGNFGTLNGNGQTGPALALFGSGIILNGATNDTAALIESNSVNNVQLGKYTTLTNYGSITGGSVNGIYAQSGFISNASTGVIIGGKWGAHVAGYGAQTVINAGLIEGTIGLAALAQYSYSDVFANSGTIASLLGSAGTAIAFSKGNDLLVDDPTGVFIGTVSGGAGVNTIELATGGPGIITGIGTQFTQFSDINFDAGATWRAEGNISGLAAGESINGFTQPDTIILDGFTETGFAYVSGAGLELTGSGGGTNAATIDLTGSFATTSFVVENVAAGTEILLCYLRGTRIATPAGEVAIEDIRIADTVITRFGGYRRIKWIGRQSFARRFIQDNVDRLPVKIAAGCWGHNLPKRDLSVSPGHSMLVGGVLVLAKSLVNGITITQNDCPDRVDYFQLEFETHDCILAEGVLSESYADGPGLRAAFHNAAEFYALYPAHTEPQRLSLCAPRPLEGPGLEAVLRPLLANLKTAPGPLHGCIDEISADGFIRGWALDAANPELPVLLEIIAGNLLVGTILACDYREDLRQAGLGRGHCSFTFTAPAGLLRDGLVTIRRAQDHSEILSPARANPKNALQAA